MAMAKEPGQRFQTAAAFRNALERTAGLPASAPAPPVAQPVKASPTPVAQPAIPPVPAPPAQPGSSRPLWLMDEPLSSLDAAGRRFTSELIGEHCDAGGIAIVATHETLGLDAHRFFLGPV